MSNLEKWLASNPAVDPTAEAGFTYNGKVYRKIGTKYYLMSDRSGFSVSKEGYSSYFEQNIYILPKETSSAVNRNVELINASQETPKYVTVYGKTYYLNTPTGSLEDPNNLTLFGGMSIIYNGGALRTVSSMAADTKGEYSLTLPLYQKLIDNYRNNGVYNNFDGTMAGYKLEGFRYNNSSVSAEGIDDIINNTSDGGRVEVDLIFSRTDVTSTTFVGKILAYNKYTGKMEVPEAGTYQFWISVKGKTVGVTDFYDLEPEDFSINVDEAGEFSFTSDALPLEATGSSTYIFKFRSEVYKNFNLVIGSDGTAVETASSHGSSTVTTVETYGDNTSVFNVTLNVAPREEHWSDAEVDEEGNEEGMISSLISRIRIRLGADILDGEAHGDGDNGIQEYDYSYKDDVSNLEYEGSNVVEKYNTYTYIEAWLNSAAFNDILMMVENFVLGMIGITGVATDQTISAQDISLGDYTEDGDFNLSFYTDEDIERKGEAELKELFVGRYKGRYNENDIKIFDKVYVDKGAYYQASHSALAKMSPGLVHYIIAMVLDGFVGTLHFNLLGEEIGVMDLIAFLVLSPGSFTIIPYIGSVFNTAGLAVGNLLNDLAILIGHLLPLQLSYSMFDTMDLKGSPLYGMQEYFREGQLSGQTVTVTGADGKTYTRDLYRKAQTYDMSVYAKITLNASAPGGYLESILLFVNGASYSQSSEISGNLADGNRMESYTALQQGDWNYNYWENNGRVGNYFTLKTVYATEKEYLQLNPDEEIPENAQIFFKETSSETYVPYDANWEEVYADRELEMETVTGTVDGEEVAKQVPVRYAMTETQTETVVSSEFTYNVDNSATHSIKSVDIKTLNIIVNGVVQEENLAFMEDWIKRTNINSYAISDVYYIDPDTEEEVIYNRVFIYDDEQNPKEDVYQELEIKNNGIDLRKVDDDLNGDFYTITYDPYDKLWTKALTVPPTRIIFHDPFDMTDFTVIGGTWASSEGYGGTRRNTDPDITADMILPNRYYATFADGNSNGTQGMNVYWDVSALNFNANGTPEGTVEYLKGYIGNAVYAAIEVVVEPFSIDLVSAKAQIIQQIGNLVIDPYDFDAEEFIAGLPDFFYYNYDSTSGGEQRQKTYLFNELVWSLDYQVIDGVRRYTSLVYNDPNTQPYVNLKFRAYGEDADGNEYSSNTAWTSVQIPFSMLNYEIKSVSSAVENSIGGIVPTEENGYHGVITFNPLNNRDPYATMQAIASFDTVNIKNELEYDGTVKKEVKDWAVIPGSFTSLTVNGKNLANYDRNDTSEQTYAVSYKITDGTGYVQTVMIQVKILASGIAAGESYYLDKDGKKVFIEANRDLYPYGADKEENDEIEDLYSNGSLIDRLYLTDELYVMYESGYDEKVSLGKDYTTERIVYATYDPVTGTLGAEGATVITGEGFSYKIPYMTYSEGKEVVINAIIGQHGYAQWQLDAMVTDILLANMPLIYTLNRAKQEAYDKLYETLDAYGKLQWTKTLSENGDNKASAWDAWYAIYSEPGNAATYSVNDTLKLDILLTSVRLSHSTLTYEAAQAQAYQRLINENSNPDADLNLISVTELRNLYAEITEANPLLTVRHVPEAKST